MVLGGDGERERDMGGQNAFFKYCFSTRNKSNE